MIARLFIRLPFLAIVTDGAHFPVGTYDDEGYQIVVRPPGRTNTPLTAHVPEKITVDDRPAFVADGLSIDFRKDHFDRRRGGSVDPPEEVIKRAIDRFLVHLRYVTRAHQIGTIPFPRSSWRIQYLNDDETPVPTAEGLYRARGALSFDVSLVHVSPGVYNDAFELDLDWDIVRWHDLLVDATGALPKVGTALVLAATALEVFISDVLNQLARRDGIEEDLWRWLNERDHFLKDPSTEEQLDVLLSHFVGHSLKDDTELWEAFKHIRKARNSFVHDGAATIGRDEVTPATAAKLINQAWRIVMRVREWLPAELRWPVFDHRADIKMEFPLS